MRKTSASREVALILLHECEDEVSGKTLLQKLAYFLAVRKGMDLGFEPHFFGPFSRELEQEVELLVMSEFAKEETTVIGTAGGGVPIANTRYQLTEGGRREAAQAVEQHKELADEAKEISRILRESHALTARRISLAAKVHYVLQSKRLPMTGTAISAKSRDLGWRVGEDDVEVANKVLGDLHLVSGI